MSALDVLLRLTGGVILVCLCLVGPNALGGEDANPGADESVAFSLEEVSVFTLGDNPYFKRVWGQVVLCQAEPFAEVRKYPALQSKQPWYGKVLFQRSWDSPEAGVTYYLVVDGPTGAPIGEKSTSEGLWQGLARMMKGEPGKDAAGESLAYDRLYFDLNGDLDLTNDPVAVPMKDRPAQAIADGTPFECIDVPLDFGPSLGIRPVRLWPQFAVRPEVKTVYVFLASTTTRAGRVRLGQREYDAWLYQSSLISGRHDTWASKLLLLPAGEKRREWTGGDEITVLRPLEGELYRTTTTSAGDQLFIAPYRGDFGTLEASAGGRPIPPPTLEGELRCRDAIVHAGKIRAEGGFEAASSCQVPVGDYYPWLHLHFGRVGFALGVNFHADGVRRGRKGNGTNSIKIRKDLPFVLDFSRRPDILFASPAKDQTFHPDDEIQVYAVLIDPVLDVMIRDMRVDNPPQEKPEGQSQPAKKRTDLEPTVTITDASGKVVAEGTMPFG